jgi:hypothetical protein
MEQIYNSIHKDGGDDDENFCIICKEQNGIIKLCLYCNFMYCNDCANKINNSCCICSRNSNKKNILTNNYNFYPPNIDTYELEYDDRFFLTYLTNSISTFFVFIITWLFIGFITYIFLKKIIKSLGICIVFILKFFKSN